MWFGIEARKGAWKSYVHCERSYFRSYTLSDTLFRLHFSTSPADYTNTGSKYSFTFNSISRNMSANLVF
ncbi:hypothetical protein PHET_00370 [Paragonimus heterotremus]|uniref:Uncharacterized protein n=1 Tax=Paragonimus heterotremus TaxID=100268 RepID=A0A8J4T728_9TREM|nr:hypothetical protein PHET_00370 [Paragonimus heterotremus]